MNFLFTLVLLGIAVYVLYSAIVAKGRLFSTENIITKKIPQFVKLLRPIYFVLGGIMLLMALLSGFQNLVYSENVYRFTDDFRLYYAKDIDANGNIAETGANVDGVYGYSQMSSIFSSLESPEVPDGVTPSYAEALTADNGQYLFLGVGETELHQNETYNALRSFLSYRATQVLTWVFMGLAIVVVVGLFVLIHRFTDKEKAEKARARAQSGSSNLPSSAFDFEEDESESSEEA